MHKKEIGSITKLWRSQLKKYLCPLAQQAQQVQEEQRALQSPEAQRIVEMHREQLKQIQKHNFDATADH